MGMNVTFHEESRLARKRPPTIHTASMPSSKRRETPRHEWDVRLCSSLILVIVIIVWTTAGGHPLPWPAALPAGALLAASCQSGVRFKRGCN